MMLLFVIMGLAGVTVTNAIGASHQSIRDKSVKRTIAAADAGAGVANYRLNKLSTSALQCVIQNAANGQLQVGAVLGDNWCPEQSENLGDDGSYTYRISAAAAATGNGQSLLQRKIVSTGIFNGVRRKILEIVASSTGASPFGNHSVISLDDLSLTNSSRIQGNVGSNGNITLSNSAEVCGNVTIGVGKQFTTANSSHQCSGFTLGPATQPLVLDTVEQGVAATVSDNARIGVQDSFSGAIPSGTWDSVKRTLRLRNQTVLTLSGNVYSFCRLELSNNAQLSIAGRAPSQPPLKIFLDDPASCPGVSDAGSVRVRNNSSFQNLNANATTLQILMVGNAVTTTTLEFSNSFSSQVPLVVYAPRSTVLLQNSQNFVGAVAAKQVSLQNSARITGQAGNFLVGALLPIYKRQSWTECMVEAAGSSPDAGC